MAGELSDTRLILNELKPKNCNCSEINGLAYELDAADARGGMGSAEAIGFFEECIDPNCQGKRPLERDENECRSDGCGIPKEECGHSRKGAFLIAQMMKIKNV